MLSSPVIPELGAIRCVTELRSLPSTNHWPSVFPSPPKIRPTRPEMAVSPIFVNSRSPTSEINNRFQLQEPELSIYQLCFVPHDIQF